MTVSEEFLLMTVQIKYVEYLMYFYVVKHKVYICFRATGKENFTIKNRHIFPTITKITEHLGQKPVNSKKHSKENRRYKVCGIKKGNMGYTLVNSKQHKACSINSDN